jgi:SAM-dependent methyltransferase
VIFLVCPLCRGALSFNAQDIRCAQCGEAFGYRDGFPDLVAGGRFDDEDDPERTAYEEESNAFLATNYLIPTLRRILPERRARVLSLGCGTGVDVDLLAAAGFDVAGIDCGNRSASWPRRAEADRLCLANGKHLPFESGSFDAVYCGCVFPHVGVEGDTNKVRPDYQEERLQIAREITRVLKRGGRVMASSPNRWFPLDIFHGRSPEQPMPRVNPPWNPFLLSAGDYRRMFTRSGCERAELLPVTGYWGFIRMKRRLRGRLLAFPVETTFRAVSIDSLRWLRGSPISPWIVMLAEKSHAA